MEGGLEPPFLLFRILPARIGRAVKNTRVSATRLDITVEVNERETAESPLFSSSTWRGPGFF
jgi:hypothetical protein